LAIKVILRNARCNKKEPYPHFLTYKDQITNCEINKKATLYKSKFLLSKTYFKKVPFKIQNVSDVHAASSVAVTYIKIKEINDSEFL